MRSQKKDENGRREQTEQRKTVEKAWEEIDVSEEEENSKERKGG